MVEQKEKDPRMIPQIDSNYRKILIAAKRAKQLMKGARPRVNLPDAKPTRIALEEVERGLINFEIAPPDKR
jgi:DNA-directed RNA polymerase subunit omega